MTIFPKVPWVALLYIRPRMRNSVLLLPFDIVLVFFADTSLTIHLDAMMRLHEWQAKANRCNVKLKFNKYSTNKDKDSSLDRRQRLKKKLKLSEHKSLRKIRKHTAAVLSASE